jgi:hypothetical protein
MFFLSVGMHLKTFLVKYSVDTLDFIPEDIYIYMWLIYTKVLKEYIGYRVGYRVGGRVLG